MLVEDNSKEMVCNSIVAVVVVELRCRASLDRIVVEVVECQIDGMECCLAFF